MTFAPEDKARHVLPRWRPSRSSSAAHELAPSRGQRAPVSAADDDFSAREADFLDEPGFWTAADLVSTAVARGIVTEVVRGAAQHITQAPHLTSAMRKVLNRIDSGGESEADTAPLSLTELDENVHHRVRTLRDSLRLNPRNALRWLDLGLAHLTLGHVESADRAIRSALSIAPQNRVVLRSSARFFVHTRREDEALHWLERSGRVPSDPWIMSAHLAVSQAAEAPLKHFRVAREMLNDTSFAPLSASELFAAVASEELSAGRDRPARKLMSSALREPTENSVAQAIWSLDRGLSGFEVNRTAVPKAYEAQTLSAMQVQDWEVALSAVEAWLGDEPFSVRAAMHASYIALTGLEKYDTGLEFVQRGLRTSPDDPILLNNAAFALANLGRPDEASVFINRVATDDPLLGYMAEATRGLIDFRQGRLEEGRGLYRRATAGFKKESAADAYALCLTMWAREEMRARTDIGERLLDEATALVSSNPNRHAKIWMERIRRQLRSGS